MGHPCDSDSTTVREEQGADESGETTETLDPQQTFAPWRRTGPKPVEHGPPSTADPIRSHMRQGDPWLQQRNIAVRRLGLEAGKGI